MLRCGFPIAEIAADGSSVITKHTRDGGMVTVDTVTAQLVYEIQGPRYLNPDATVHLDTVQLSQVGTDRVAIAPVTGSPPPGTAKVAVFAQIGWQISQMLFCTSPNVAEKVALLRDQLRVGFHHDGGAQPIRNPWPRIDYWPALLPAELVPNTAVLPDGTRIEAPMSSCWATPEELAQGRSPEPPRPPRPGAGCRSARSPTAAPETRAVTPTSVSGPPIPGTGSGCDPR